MSNQENALRLLIKRPVITEKSVEFAQKMMYTFVVDSKSNKIQLKKAFELVFPGRKVTNIATIKIPAYKTRRYGKKAGYVSSAKKAIFSVTGEPIEMFTGV
ncbi:MAG: 50S ribosomal protein L23 [Cyanobacteria bacterium P01_H01_bin.74]